MNSHKMSITGIDCANCAKGLERQIAKIAGLENVSINFMQEKLMFDCEDAEYESLIQKILEVTAKFEPDAIIEIVPQKKKSTHHHHEGEECLCEHEHHHHEDEECSCGHDHHHHEDEECSCGHDHHHHEGEECSCGHDHHHHEDEECSCGHDHHHHEDEECSCEHEHKAYETYKMEITDIDCPHCSEKLKNAVEKIEGISYVAINHIRERIVFDCEESQIDRIVASIKDTIESVLPEANLGEIISHKSSKNLDEHKHEENCSCGHEHHSHNEGEECSCGHDHHHHSHAEELRAHKMSITGIDCANCAAHLERQIAKIQGLENVQVNFMKEKLSFECAPERYDELMDEIRKCVEKNEPDAVMGEDEMKKSHSHEHHHGHDEESRAHKMSITGIDCANCAAHLERQIAKIRGLENVQINFMKEKLSFECDSERYDELMDEIRKCVEKNEPDAVMGEDEMKKSHSHEHHHDQDEIDESTKIHSGSQKFSIHGIDCANCAATLERKLADIDCIDNVTLTFMNETLSFDLKSGTLENAVEKIKQVIAESEPDCTLETGTAVKPIVKKTRHKKEKTRIGVSVVFLVIALILEKALHVNFFVSAVFYMISYFSVGSSVLKSAFRNLGKGQWMDEKFLMAIATVGAIGTGELEEGVFVMLLYQIGELFQAIAVENSRESITELMDIKADVAHLKYNGKVETVDVEEIQVGDIIVIRPGEKVPLDGVIITGESSINTAALTGESLPRDVSVGDDVVSGTVNIQSLLEVRVSKESSESTVSKILDLVENSSNRKAHTENFISAFAKYYTPIVVYLAIFVGFIVPAILAFMSPDKGYMAYLPDYFHRALMFLVVSCPCAIVISVPLTYFSGIGGLSKKGVLVKGSNYLDALNDVDTVVFDKTGTITKGKFAITKIESVIDEAELLKITAHAEFNSTHPIAKAIVATYGKDKINQSSVTSVKEIAGHGIEAEINGDTILAGNLKLMSLHGINAPATEEIGTTVYVACNDKYCGYIVVADEIKESSADAMKALIDSGIRSTVMLTGDNDKIANAIAEKVGISKVFSNLLPQDKVNEFSKLNENSVCAYVGDGINDAPVLAMSKVGIAMGGLGSDAAIEAADIVIMNDDLLSVAEAVKGAKKTRKIVMQNIYFSLAVKIIILLVSAFGITTNMMIAIFGDVGVMLLAVLNAIRALK